MHKITLLIEGPEDAAELLPLVVAWAQEDPLRASLLLQAQPGQSYVNQEGHLQMPTLDGLDLLAQGLEALPAFKALVSSVRTFSPGATIPAMHRHASTTDLFVLSARSFRLLMAQDTGEQPFKGLEAPLLIPGKAYSAHSQTVLLAEPHAVKRAMQTNRRLLASREMVILSCNEENPEDDRRLVEYVQAHYKGPGYYFLPPADGCSPPPPVMNPGALVVGTLDPQAHSHAFLKELLQAPSFGDYSYLLHA